MLLHDDTDFVLHDVGEELKPGLWLPRSEKFAISCGLIALPNPHLRNPLSWIIKNLEICCDMPDVRQVRFSRHGEGGDCRRTGSDTSRKDLAVAGIIAGTVTVP